MDTILLLDYQNFVWKGVVDFGAAKDPKAPKAPKAQSYTIVFNFYRNLRNLIEQFYPTKIFLCNEGGKSFRHDLYSGYKANRIIKTAEEAHSQKTLQSFYTQADIIWDTAKHLPLHRVFASGFEADDVIATLAVDLKDEDVIIVSNDSDYIQLLQKDDTKNLGIFNPFSREYVDAPPYHYLTYKICAGDKADNIPGLVSPKKALALAAEPKALAAFISSSEEARENYLLNKALIELTPIAIDKITFLPYNVDYDELRRVFGKMGFRSINKDFAGFSGSFASLN